MKPMTEEEFKDQYARLKDVHPTIFGSVEKMTTTWAYVKEMDFDWFKRVTDRIVMSMNPRSDEFDISKLVAAEKRHRRSIQFAEDVAGASAAWNKCTEQGLENTLGKYKANSLLEAVEKSRKGEL